jgi:hypothetical protein
MTAEVPAELAAYVAQGSGHAVLIFRSRDQRGPKRP